MEYFVWIPIGLIVAAITLVYLHRGDRELTWPPLGEIALAVLGGVAFGVAFGTVDREVGGRTIIIAFISVVLSGMLAIVGSERRHAAHR